MTADGKGLVGHAGAVLLRKLADRIGLTRGLAEVLPTSTAAGWRERAAVLVQLAVTIVLGARSLLEAEQLQLHHQGLFGPAVSDSTTRRVLAGLDEQTLTRIGRCADGYAATCGCCCACGPAASRGSRWPDAP